MKRAAGLILFVAVIFLSCWINVFPCTGVTAKTSSGILVASNEDFNTTYKDVVARVRPAASGKYGYLATGFERHDYFMMGLNDRGLFLDMFALPSCFQWERDPDKLDFNGQLERKMLEECATAEQVVAATLC